MTETQIKNAYLNVFGTEPSTSEIIEIQNNEEFFGNSSRSVAEKLIQTPRFLNQPKTTDNIERTFQLFFGGKPTEDEIKEIKSNNDYWGENLGNVTSGLKRTPRWNENNPINIRPITDDAGGEALSNEPSNDQQSSQPKKNNQQSSQPKKNNQQSSQPKNDEITRENRKVPGTSEHTKKVEEDLKSMGITDEELQLLDDTTKDFIGTVSEEINNVDNLNPLPTAFTPDVLDQLYQQAIENPKIQEHYQRLENRAIEDVLGSVAEAQEDLGFQTRRRLRDFKRQKEDFAGKAEQAGILYSGKREEASEELEEEQSDVITSQVRQAKKQLDRVGRQAEQTLGTEKVKNLDLSLSVPDIENINTSEVSNMLNRGEITFDEYSEAIRPEESELGRQKFEETRQEYERLVNERDILANPESLTR